MNRTDDKSVQRERIRQVLKEVIIEYMRFVAFRLVHSVLVQKIKML